MSRKLCNTIVDIFAILAAIAGCGTIAWFWPRFGLGVVGNAFLSLLLVSCLAMALMAFTAVFWDLPKD